MIHTLAILEVYILLVNYYKLSDTLLVGCWHIQDKYGHKAHNNILLLLVLNMYSFCVFSFKLNNYFLYWLYSYSLIGVVLYAVFKYPLLEVWREYVLNDFWMKNRYR